MQQADSKYPDLIIRKGFGAFSTAEISFEASFEICHYPQKTIINVEIPDNHIAFKLIAHQSDEWELDGKTENNIPVKSKSLLFYGRHGNQLNLFSFKDLHFGLDIESGLRFAEFPLVGIYDLSYQIIIDGWNIEFIGDKNELSEINSKSRNWNLQLEGNIVRLTKENATKEEFLSKICDITSLLSLATGNDIAFNRQLFYQENNLIHEEWRRRVDYHFGAERCIPDFKMDKFLMQTLPCFENWDGEKKKIFFTIVNYINSSSKGYLEDRILRICIAWESLAQSWGSKTIDNNRKVLQPLKNILKKTIKDYNLPDGYEKDFMITRVIGSLDWERNTNKLIAFAKQYNLDFEKMGLDFQHLNKIRNDVAHTGLFREKPSNDILTDLLYNHKTSLQILLLLELGYNDLIESEENKWSKTIKISELLNK
jgi:hypothetical protein